MEKILIFIGMAVSFLSSVFLIKTEKIYKVPYIFVALVFASLFFISIKLDFHEIIFAILSFILVVLIFIKKNYVGFSYVYIFINLSIIFYCISLYYYPALFNVIFGLVFSSFLSFLIISKQKFIKQIIFLISAMIFSYVSFFIDNFILFYFIFIAGLEFFSSNCIARY